MSDKMPDAWIVPSASGDGYLCTLSHVNLPGWNRYVPAARIAELEAAEAVLHAKGEMLFAVVKGAKEEFVRVPYGASHEDVAAINEWHGMAAEALAAWEGDE